MTPDEIKEVLRKRNIFIIEHNKGSYDWSREDGVSGTTKFDFYIVMWDDGVKVKYGKLNADYCHRYGINVLSTFNGRTFWYQSGNVAEEMPELHMNYMKVMADGNVPVDHKGIHLKSFNPDVLIDVRW